MLDRLPARLASGVGTRSCDASEQDSAAVPLRPLLQAPPAEQAPVGLISALYVDLATPPPVTSPFRLSFPSSRSPHVVDSRPPRAPSNHLPRPAHDPSRPKAYPPLPRPLLAP